MSIFSIIGVISMILQAAGVYKWLADWLVGLLRKWGLANSACQVVTEGDLNALTYRMFNAVRPDWFHPLRRLAHGLCWKIAERNQSVLFAHTIGAKAGQPISPDDVVRADADQLRFLALIEDNLMHDDFKAMVEDMDATFNGGKVAANPTMAFFDGTIIGLISKFKAAGADIGTIIKWIQVAVLLVTTLGPKLEEIWQVIQDAINGGKSPKDVLSDLIVVG